MMGRKPGRPKLSDDERNRYCRVSFQLTADEYAEFKRLCDLQEVTMSQVARYYCKGWIRMKQKDEAEGKPLIDSSLFFAPIK